MGPVRRELVIEFQSRVVRAVEVELDRAGRPIPVRCAAVPLLNDEEDDILYEAIRSALTGAGIRLRNASLVIGRRDLIIRPEEVPEAIAAKPTGYAVSAISRLLPSPEVGEIAGACIPAGPASAGRTPCLIAGARVSIIEPYFSLMEKDGVKITSVLPTTAGTLRVMKLTLGEGVTGIGMRVEPDGAEIVSLSSGTAVTSIWLPAPEGDDDSFATLAAAEISRLAPSGANPVWIFGSRADASFAAMLGTALGFEAVLLTPWFGDSIHYSYEPGQGRRFEPNGSAYAVLVGAAFSPSAVNLRTQRMLAQETAFGARRTKIAIGTVGLAALAIGFGAWWLAGVGARAEATKLEAEYAAIAAKTRELAAIEAKTREAEDRITCWGQSLSQAPDWNGIMSGIQSALYTDIRLESIKLDGVKDSVILGLAPDGQSVASLAQRLVQVPGIGKAEVSYLRSVAKTEGVEFGMILTLKGWGATK